jgi:hypothetical protein
MFPRKATVPKPLEHWFNDIVAITRLREILDDPILQLACATLTNAAQPTYSSIVGSSGNNERICWLGGYTDFYRDLQKLTKSPTSRNSVPEEWSHIE